MPALAARYRCEHIRNSDHTSLGSCSRCSTGSGARPSITKCRCCGGQILIEHGLWTVRQWDVDRSGYYDMDVIATFKTERGARGHIERNPDQNWVWHWVPEGPTVVYER